MIKLIHAKRKKRELSGSGLLAQVTCELFIREKTKRGKNKTRIRAIVHVFPDTYKLRLRELV